MMKICEENPQNECVVCFGTAGWSSYFIATNVSNPVDEKRMENLMIHANRMLPKEVKNSHPANSRVTWMRIYRFEKEIELAGYG